MKPPRFSNKRQAPEIDLTLSGKKDLLNMKESISRAHLPQSLSQNNN